MTRLVAVGIVLVVVASGVGVAAADTPASTTQNAPAPSATTEATANESDDRQFGFRIKNTTDCGFTCRDVAIVTTNTGNETAENITVSTRLATGGTVVWQGDESVSELEPGEAMTVTKRVQLDFVDAVRVQQNGGYMTANTTVAWDGGEEQFTERRKVT